MESAPAPTRQSEIAAERRRLESHLTRAMIAMFLIAALCVLTSFVGLFLGEGGGPYGFLAILAAMLGHLAYLQRAAVRLSRNAADAVHGTPAGRGSAEEAWTLA
jgi:hypothetical protein